MRWYFYFRSPALATLSNGEVFEAPKPLKKSLKKLKRLQRRLCRRQKDSHNRYKLKQQIAKVHAKIVNIRQNLYQIKLSFEFDQNVIKNVMQKGGYPFPHNPIYEIGIFPAAATSYYLKEQVVFQPYKTR